MYNGNLGDQFPNDIGRFTLSLELSFSGPRPGIRFCAANLILTGKQGKGDRQERVAVAPAQLKEAEPARMPALGVVKLERRQFDVLGMGAFIHGIIDKEHVLTCRVGQRIDESNDLATEQIRNFCQLILPLLSRLRNVLSEKAS